MDGVDAPDPAGWLVAVVALSFEVDAAEELDVRAPEAEAIDGAVSDALLSVEARAVDVFGIDVEAVAAGELDGAAALPGVSAAVVLAAVVLAGVVSAGVSAAVAEDFAEEDFISEDFDAAALGFAAVSLPVSGLAASLPVSGVTF